MSETCHSISHWRKTLIAFHNMLVTPADHIHNVRDISKSTVHSTVHVNRLAIHQ